LYPDLLPLSLTMFSHTPWSSLRHDWRLHKINKCDCIRLHLQNTLRALVSSSPSMFIRSLITIQPKSALQKQTNWAVCPCTFLFISHLLNFTCLQHQSPNFDLTFTRSGASHPLVTNAVEEISNYQSSKLLCILKNLVLLFCWSPPFQALSFSSGSSPVLVYTSLKNQLHSSRPAATILYKFSSAFSLRNLLVFLRLSVRL
jgi:hypothetical protein